MSRVNSSATHTILKLRTGKAGLKMRQSTKPQLREKPLALQQKPFSSLMAVPQYYPPNSTTALSEEQDPISGVALS